MLKGDNDKRDYHTLSLSNGLDVLVVHNPTITKTAVSMGIGVGHFHDMAPWWGLSHVLEHMIFLGSEGYSEPNHLDAYVSSYGGSVNAWTASEYSNFHFDVHSHALPEALKIFATMLRAPLFDLNMLDNEINAVDAEFNLKRKDDLRRLYQVHKETCNPAHPFSQFSVGNAQTLRSKPLNDLRDAMVDLHQQHYIAGNMRLCIQSNLPVDTLEELAENCFGDIQKGVVPDCKPMPALYLPEQLGVRIDIKPIQHAQRLIITFALPNMQQYYRSKPLGLISHIIGDESAGSLLNQLKSKRWVTNLSAGSGIQGSNFQDFNINMQLTDDGLAHIDQIVLMVFSYIEKVRKDIDAPWRYEEKIRLNQLALSFAESGKILDETIHLAAQMFVVEPDYIAVADCYLDKPDLQLVRQMLDQLKADNMRLKVISPAASTDRSADWYQTPYSISPLSEQFIAACQHPPEEDGLQLPTPNPYLVNSIDLVPQDGAYAQPDLLVDTNGLQLWFAQDHKFALPKGDTYLSVESLNGVTDEKNHLVKKMWVAMMMEQFSQHYYQASVAGLNYHLYAHQGGFSLHTSGFSDKQLQLSIELLHSLRESPPDQACFDLIKKKQQRTLQNALLNKPINRLFTRLSVIMQRNAFSPADLLATLDNCHYQDIVTIQHAVFQDSYMEGLVHGNWRVQQVHEFAEQIKSVRASLSVGDRVSRDITDLREQPRLVHEVQSNHDDAAAVIYFQAQGAHMHDIALAVLTEQLFAASFFNHMRTHRQLGYLVGSGYMPFNQHPGMAFYVQSPNTPAAKLVEEMENYLIRLFSHPLQFAENWEHIHASVHKQVLETDQTLSMKSQRLWMAIGNRQVDFAKQHALASAVDAITFEDIQAFCAKLIARDQIGNLVLLCNGQQTNAGTVNGQYIEDIQAFKRQSTFTI